MRRQVWGQWGPARDQARVEQVATRPLPPALSARAPPGWGEGTRALAEAAARTATPNPSAQLFLGTRAVFS